MLDQITSIICFGLHVSPVTVCNVRTHTHSSCLSHAPCPAGLKGAVCLRQPQTLFPQLTADQTTCSGSPSRMSCLVEARKATLRSLAQPQARSRVVYMVARVRIPRPRLLQTPRASALSAGVPDRPLIRISEINRQNRATDDA